jgi:hypothetical protein
MSTDAGPNVLTFTFEELAYLGFLIWDDQRALPEEEQSPEAMAILRKIDALELPAF